MTRGTCREWASGQCCAYVRTRTSAAVCSDVDGRQRNFQFFSIFGYAVILGKVKDFCTVLKASCTDPVSRVYLVSIDMCEKVR
jgi:hypothetical protein